MNDHIQFPKYHLTSVTSDVTNGLKFHVNETFSPPEHMIKTGVPSPLQIDQPLPYAHTTIIIVSLSIRPKFSKSIIARKPSVQHQRARFLTGLYMRYYQKFRGRKKVSRARSHPFSPGRYKLARAGAHPSSADEPRPYIRRASAARAAVMSLAL